MKDKKELQAILRKSIFYFVWKKRRLWYPNAYFKMRVIIEEALAEREKFLR